MKPRVRLVLRPLGWRFYAIRPDGERAADCSGAFTIAGALWWKEIHGWP